VFESRYMPCQDCGASVDVTSSTPHRCAPERVADFQMFALRDEVAHLEDRYREFLDSRHGRFETWLAARQVREAG
jgi:hypothetical protein